MKVNFNSVLREIGESKTEELIDWLVRHNFYTIPASRGNHNNIKGGLLKHSLEVCNEALRLWKKNTTEHPELQNTLSKKSVAKVALLHDICKWNVYYISPKDHRTIRKNKESEEEGHGLKTVKILERIGYVLTEDEKMAIWWHMGTHEPSIDEFRDEYERSKSIELCNLLRQADYNATHQKEIFTDAVRNLTKYDTNGILRYLSSTDFYKHKSGSHHHYKTGTVSHTLGVWRRMMKTGACLDNQEAAAVALFHDICMNNNCRGCGHGRASKRLLQKYEVGLPADVLDVIEKHRHHTPHDWPEGNKKKLHRALYSADHFDADHDITDLKKHYDDEIF